MKFDALVLCGGGVKGLTLLGTLQYLYTKTEYLKNMEYYSGTSIGSIICVLLCLNFSPVQLFSHSYAISSSNMLECTFQDVLNIPTKFGIKSNQQLIESFLSILKNQLEVNLLGIKTLYDLYIYTNKMIYICTTQLPNKKPVYLNAKDHPHLPIIDALRMSCNIPILFTKIEYNEYLYIDGALTDNLPIFPLSDKKVLCINIEHTSKIRANEMGLVDYLYEIFMPARNYNQRYEKAIIIEIPNFDIDTLGLDLTLEKRRKIFYQAFKKCEEIIDKLEIEEFENNDVWCNE